MMRTACRFRTSFGRRIAAGLCLAVALMPGWCLAHVEEAQSGFTSGLLHPVFGFDHFLAMLSVGIVSAQLGARHVWGIPSAFVLWMVAGASTGLLGHALPFLEWGIGLSVVFLGASIALVRRGMHAAAIYAFASFFGFLHGYAHGLEMPKAADPVYYAGGFLTSTVAIHLLGVGIGHTMTSRDTFRPALRYLGLAIAAMGLVILIQLMRGD